MSSGQESNSDMSSRFEFHLRLRPKGFALIITLIMLVLAAVIVVALMSSASLDRGTAKSVNDRYQADLAVQNGLEAAKKVLSASPGAATNSITANDTFAVFRIDGTQGPNSYGNRDSYYFLVKARPRDPDGISRTADCYPLFSGGATAPLTIDHTNYPPIQRPTAPTSANAALDSVGKPYPVLLPHEQRAFTQWQEIRNPNDNATAPAHNLPYQRYAFWVEDLAGYVDASVAGNESGTPAHVRASGTNPNEIALFTIFDAANPNDPGNTRAKDLIDNRAVLFTVPTLTQIPSPTPPGQDLTSPSLAVRLGIDGDGEQNLIPFGFGYQDEGAVKTNVNTVLTDGSAPDAKVTTIYNVINRNLPQFATLRRGALPGTDDYVKTLAANMIDYADSDSDATVGTNYRGIDSYPFLVEYFNRYNWEGPTNYYQNGTPPTWWAKVRVTGWVQIWNMTNRDIASGTLEFTDINRYGIKVGSNDYKYDDHLGTINFSSSPLGANQFKVFQLYDKTYSFDSGVAPPANPPSTSTSPIKMGQQGNVTAEHYESGYLMKWNGKIVARAGSGTRDGTEPTTSPTGPNTQYPNLNYYGVQRKAATLQTAQSQLDPSWRGTLPGLRYDDLSETVFNLGDPRTAYYVAWREAAVAYAKRPSGGSGAADGNSSWWGRIYQKGLIEDSTNWNAAETKVANWPDGDHITTHGLLPTSTTVDPSSLSSSAPATEPNKAPVLISNVGTYVSIAELGQIYDAIQWRPHDFRPTGSKPSSPAEMTAVWNDAWKNDMDADQKYGVASTLRIGSPEFKQFDKDDSRASQLMDLFATADRTPTRGMININTASRDVLRTLGAGIELKRDLSILPASVFGPTNNPGSPTQADKFADAVIASRPFLTTSQLSGILTNPSDRTSKFFGNASQWSTGAPTEWADRAREEYFSRMFNLTTVRSRNFRVFVTGQSLNKDGKVLSTVNRVFQVYLNPTRDTVGEITSQRILTRYEKDI